LHREKELHELRVLKIVYENCRVVRFSGEFPGEKMVIPHILPKFRGIFRQSPFSDWKPIKLTFIRVFSRDSRAACENPEMLPRILHFFARSLEISRENQHFSCDSWKTNVTPALPARFRGSSQKSPAADECSRKIVRKRGFRVNFTAITRRTTGFLRESRESHQKSRQLVSKIGLGSAFGKSDEKRRRLTTFGGIS
jgi:hypothetical protein